MDRPSTDPTQAHEALRLAVSAVDARAALVEGATLQALIRAWCGQGRRRGEVPHRKVLVVPVAWLADQTQPQTLGWQAWPESALALLVEAPAAERWEAQPHRKLWLRTWRLLFHASVHAHLESRLGSGALTAAAVQARVHGIGRSAFDDACAVLRQEHMLLPPDDDTHAYIEVAATYLELKHFAPHALPRYFPASDQARIAATLAKDISDEALLWEARLPGLPTPGEALRREVEPPAHPDDAEAEGDAEAEEDAGASAGDADSAAAQGNMVRALLLRLRRSDAVGAATMMDAFALRLSKRLGGRAEAWRQALSPLLRDGGQRLRRGLIAPEVRLLFDLQGATVEIERPRLYLDLLRWLLSRGRAPIARHQPLRQRARVGARLARALRLCAWLRGMTEADQARLRARVEQAHTTYLAQTRALLSPLLQGALHAASLMPTSRVEAVAQHKLIEEALDLFERKGMLTLSDLRDAIARSDLKVATVEGVGQWWRDPLLLLDAQAKTSLDGIYRGGEAYLRWLQRLSAVAFGTRAGRALTLWVALPLLGAVVTLEGLQHSVGLALDKGFGVSTRFTQAWTLAPLALAFLVLLHSEAARIGVQRAARAVGSGAKRVFVTWPARVLAWPPLLALRKTPLWRALKRGVFWPGLIALALLGALGELTPWARWLTAWGVGWGVSGALYSPWGLWLRQWLIIWSVKQWRYTIRRLIPGAVRWLLDTFKSMTAKVDQALYAVDEWLRFREGEAAWLVPLKAALGLLWSVFAYIVRLYTNLLVEPQVNPVKHFPVVTVTHKMILPLTVDLTRIFAAGLQPILGVVLGGALAGVTVVLLPGVFGFLVWELKENWRMYAHNRALNITRAQVSRHGEDIGRLLRLGFHSGTIPRLYTTLRQAERQRAHSPLAAARLHRAQESLTALTQDLRGFAARDLLALLCTHPAWPDPTLCVDRVEVSSHRIELFITTANDQATPLVISFREQHGWLISELESLGWASSLTPNARALLAWALAGFYQRAGVQLCRELIARTHPDAIDYHVTHDAVLLWSGPDYQAKQTVSLVADARASAWRIDAQPIAWTAWAAAWDAATALSPAPSVLPERG